MGGKASTEDADPSHEPVEGGPETPLAWSIPEEQSTVRKPPPLPPDCSPVLAWEEGMEVRVRSIMPDQTSIGVYCRQQGYSPPYHWQEEQAGRVGMSGVMIERFESVVKLEFGGFEKAAFWWPVRSLAKSTLLGPPALPHLPMRDDRRNDPSKDAVRRASLYPSLASGELNSGPSPRARAGSSVLRKKSNVLSPSSSAGLRTKSDLDGSTSPPQPPLPKLTSGSTSPRPGGDLRDLRAEVSKPDFTSPRRISSANGPVRVVIMKAPMKVGDWVELRHPDWGPQSRYGVLVADPAERRWVPWKVDDGYASSDSGEEGRQSGSRRGSIQREHEWFVHFVFDDGTVVPVPRDAQSVRPKRADVVQAWWNRVFKPWVEEQQSIWLDFKVGDITGLDPKSKSLADAARERALERSRRTNPVGSGLSGSSKLQRTLSGSMRRTGTEGQEGKDAAKGPAANGPAAPDRAVLRKRIMGLGRRGHRKSEAHTTDASGLTPVSEAGGPLRTNRSEDKRQSLSPPSRGDVLSVKSEDEMEEGPYLPELPVQQGVPLGQGIKAYDEWWLRAQKRYWQQHLLGYYEKEHKALTAEAARAVASGSAPDADSGLGQAEIPPALTRKKTEGETAMEEDLTGAGTDPCAGTEPFAVSDVVRDGSLARDSLHEDGRDAVVESELALMSSSSELPGPCPTPVISLGPDPVVPVSRIGAE